VGVSSVVPVRRSYLPGGDVGVLWTLANMGRVARAAASHPLTQQAAANAANGARDGVGVWRNIRAWLQRVTRFQWDADDPVAQADPRIIEVVHTPLDQLEHLAQTGSIPGDCDDVATLAAALVLALGRRARFIVLGFRAPASAAPFQHVFTDMLIAPDAWGDFDITRRPSSEQPTRRLAREV
jgi:hypothetical protein